mgnify:FL=1
MPSPFHTRVIATQMAGGSPGINVETLTGTKTLVDSDKRHQRLDPDGAKNVVLPAEEGSAGREFWIWNAASGSEDITVKNDAASTIGTVSQNEGALYVCDGSAWVMVFIMTGAIA